MGIVACSQCGSKNIRQGTIQNGVLTGYTSRDVCRDCGSHALPIIFDTEQAYRKFLDEIKKPKQCSIKQEPESKKEETQKIKNQRPIGITLLSCLMILGGITTLFGYYQYVHIEKLPYLNIWTSTYYLVVMVTMAFFLPYGFMTQKRWAWTLAGILYILFLPICQ